MKPVYLAAAAALLLLPAAASAAETVKHFPIPAARAAYPRLSAAP